MNRATAQTRSFAGSLLAFELLMSKSAKVKAAATFHVVDRLRPNLTALMGNSGFRALLARALVLASVEVSWLRATHVKADSTVAGLAERHAQLEPDEFREGEVVLVACLLGLLVAFIGPRLTFRLVSDIWPAVSLNERDLGTGGKK